eukprot:TRINITY_DN7928_c0_g1_i14.p4 TRINITY_DN7928_c0_g1~~TRINITY_DN7928_c0_g1_i14.p4  ORF type:complete len:201 (+),score=-2.52 TRINITY_DN7928_c0_g1_i14:1532-2134(+)
MQIFFNLKFQVKNRHSQIYFLVEIVQKNCSKLPRLAVYVYYTGDGPEMLCGRLCYVRFGGYSDLFDSLLKLVYVWLENVVGHIQFNGFSQVPVLCHKIFNRIIMEFFLAFYQLLTDSMVAYGKNSGVQNMYYIAHNLKASDKYQAQRKQGYQILVFLKSLPIHLRLFSFTNQLINKSSQGIQFKFLSFKFVWQMKWLSHE